MAHRGRLNIQANVLNKSFEEIFTEFESCYDPDEVFGAGDVKYHNGYLADIKTRRGEPLRFFLVNNPSHLESVITSYSIHYTKLYENLLFLLQTQ